MLPRLGRCTGFRGRPCKCLGAAVGRPRVSPCCASSWSSGVPGIVRTPAAAGKQHWVCVHASTSRTPALPASQPAHVPVLLTEVVDAFKRQIVHVYVDGTLGAGGHASAILRTHPEVSVLVGIDRDPAALRLAAAALSDMGTTAKLHLCHDTFGSLAAVLDAVPGGSLRGRVDALVMDLGVSSMQLDDPTRGFSFLEDGPIDMRLDPGARLSAEEVVNTWSEAALARVIREYGEEKRWRTVARRICDAREQAPLRTTHQLVRAIGETIDRRAAARLGRRRVRGLHPATRTFQALRIAVNDELTTLADALPVAIDSLAPGGRLAVISFHSLEDRLVKRAFRRAAGRPTGEEGDEELYGAGAMDLRSELAACAVGREVTRKPLMAGNGEVEANPRSRSAKLRVFEKSS